MESGRGFEAEDTPEILAAKVELEPDDPYCRATIGHIPVEQNDAVTVSCDACTLEAIEPINVLGVDSRSQATGNALAKTALKDKCGKWKRRLESGEVSGPMPDDLLSRVRVIPISQIILNVIKQ